MWEWFLRRVLRRKVRGFEVVSHWARLYPNANVTLPQRSTDGSAAYDFRSLETLTLMPGDKREVATDIKAYMPKREVLKIWNRSHQGIVHDIMLANTTALVDADFYSNETNDGRITIVLKNLGKEPYHIKHGDRIAQATFEKYYITDDDHKQAKKVRTGGVGSTGR